MGSLEILKDTHGNQWDVVIDGPITVGRAPDNDVIIRDKKVSRHHCVIEPAPGGVRVRDVGSTRGTYVNRHRVTEQLLCDGDRIFLGMSLLRYMAQEASAGMNGKGANDHDSGPDAAIAMVDAVDSGSPMSLDPDDSGPSFGDEPGSALLDHDDDSDGDQVTLALAAEESEVSFDGELDSDALAPAVVDVSEDSDLFLVVDDAKDAEDSDDSDDADDSSAIPEIASVSPAPDALSESSNLLQQPPETADATIVSDGRPILEEITASDVRASELQATLEAAEARAKELQDCLQQVEARADEATGECAALRAEQVAREAEIDHLRDRSTQLETNLSLAEEQLAAAQDEAAVTRAEEAEITKALAATLAEAEAESVRLCEALADAERVAEENARSLAEREQDLASIRAEHAQARQELDQLRLAREHAEQAATERAAEVERLQATLDDLRGSEQWVESDLEQQLAEACRVATERQADAVRLSEEVSRVRLTVNAHEGQAAALAAAAAVERDRAEQLEVERQALVEAREDAAAVATGLQSDITQLRAELVASSKKTEELQSEMDHACRAAEATGARCKRLEDELDKAQAAMSDLEGKLRTAKKVETRDDSRLIELGNALGEFQAARDDAAASHRSTLEERDERIAELEREVASLRESLAGRLDQAGVATPAERSQPSLGLVTAVAMGDRDAAEGTQNTSGPAGVDQSTPTTRLPKNPEDRDLLAWVVIGVLVVAMLGLGAYGVVKIFFS